MKLKQYRVQMDGSFTVWALDADEACEMGRNEGRSWIYVTETGETMEQEDSDAG